ncbi:MAG TPA: ATP-dependent DNA ligase, partial [Sphingomicrobium sp.]
MDKRGSTLAPMEALLAAELPTGKGWQYEPKWDGFRCLARRDGDEVTLTSKSGKPLARYFPDVAEMLRSVKAKRFLIDGELIIPAGDALSFEALQLRLHPAETRVRKLARKTPAELMAFDLLEIDEKRLTHLPLSKRRNKLERFIARNETTRLKLSPMTCDRKVALRWLERSGGALDGVIAKRANEEYRSGERAMVKVKQQRTADCVVGGFRYADKGKVVGSLLLGLYDHGGLLDHVGFTSAIPAKERAQLTKDLEALIEPPGFTG